MPRQPRLHLPGFPLHVTQRGVNRCAIFLDDIDRKHYYDLLLDVASEHEIAIHAYVWMSNHVHLLLSAPGREALSHTMRNTGLCYVRAFNQRHRRSGPLWQGRYKSCIVDTDHYLMTVYRYIELNPVRASMVERPEQYRWSSVHANLALRHDPLVTPHSLFTQLAATTTARADAYRQWLNEAISDEETARIRTYLQQERALGSPRFQAMAEKALGRPAVTRTRGRPTHPRNASDSG